MSERYVNPMAGPLDAEFRFIASTNRQTRRVSLKRGEAWLIRFLPAQMGDQGLWYARIAKHWLNKKPITCLRGTSPAYGGNPNVSCPVCDAFDDLNRHSDEAVRKKAWDCRSVPQWLTYCLVIEKSTGGGSVQSTDDELVQPYEFALYKSMWEELVAFFRNNSRKDNPMSVLDLVHGSDFWLSKGAKGMRLDKQDAQPILEDLAEPAEEDPRIIDIMKGCHEPKVSIPTENQLIEFASKVTDACLESVGTDPDAEDTGGEPVIPNRTGRSARTAAPAPSARRTAAPVVEDADDVDTSPPPARRPVAPPPARRAPAPAPEPEEPQDEADQGEPEPAPAPVSRRAPAPAPAARTAAAVRPAAPRTASTAKPPSGTVDDSDDLPEDDKDPVAPADEAIDEAEEPAEPVQRSSPPPAAARPAASTTNVLRQSVGARVAAIAASSRAGTRR